MKLEDDGTTYYYLAIAVLRGQLLTLASAPKVAKVGKIKISQFSLQY